MNKENKEFVPVMLTPFKDNGEIDFRGLTALTEFYLEAGRPGFLPIVSRVKCFCSVTKSALPSQNM